jgi:hypothetical protein
MHEGAKRPHPQPPEIFGTGYLPRRGARPFRLFVFPANLTADRQINSCAFVSSVAEFFATNDANYH